MEQEVKINTDKCFCDKRKLVLDCDISGHNYVFSLDGWNEPYPESLKVDGQDASYEVINAYKHNLQVYFNTAEGDGDVLFIDRRYEHNYAFNIYFQGKSYLVECSNRPSINP